MAVKPNGLCVMLIISGTSTGTVFTRTKLPTHQADKSVASIQVGPPGYLHIFL
jgi:hypothetical protein